MTISMRHCIYLFCWLFSISSISFAFVGNHRLRHRIQPLTAHSFSLHEKFNLTLCLIDHYDSYTYNLYDMLASCCTEPPIVVLAKDTDAMQQLSTREDVDGYILSPGPGRPPTDTGISLDIIANNPTVPILGVCLGHQALGHAYGAHVVEAPTPIHGQVHHVHFDGNATLWNNMTCPLQVTRYHSLVVKPWNKSPVPLVPTAWLASDENIIMALAHTSNPHFGVQFHPESIGTNQGMTLIQNFVNVCHDYKQQRENRAPNKTGLTFPSTLDQTIIKEMARKRSAHKTPVLKKGTRLQDTHSDKRKFRLHVRRVKAPEATPLDVFTTLYGNHSFAAWLDSSNADQSKERMSRFDIMAALDGPQSRRIEYFVDEQTVVEYDVNGNQVSFYEQDILSFLQDSLQSIELLKNNVDEDLPFEYHGGYVGFLGYEVRHDTQWALQHDGHKDKSKASGARTEPVASLTPSAAFLFADQTLVYDHWKREWYLVGLSDNDDGVSSIRIWMNRVERVLLTVEPSLPAALGDHARSFRNPKSITFVPNRSPRRYRSNIATCHEQIRLGESYELCLTNQLEATVSQRLSPLELYKVLRQRNPVPFAAYLNFQQGKAPLAIACSSPERFVSVMRRSPTSEQSSNQADDTHNEAQDFYVEAKPIKGTCARQVVTDRQRTISELQEDKRRARELETCVKNRAENLMIVDLLRNDLNRVCRVGSVHVPKLMQIESYTTVHQMVSTIRGTLAQDKSAIDVLQACFPGGSMTGAPKLRSMEILDSLEERVPRGPYSGCLGYISLNGCMDMNIVIRSAVLTPQNDDCWRVRIGAGGAITALSESEDEYEEMLLKARAVVEAVQAWSPNPFRADEEASTNMLLPNMTLSVTKM